MRFRLLLTALFMVSSLLMSGCVYRGAPIDGPTFAPITPLPPDEAVVYIYFPVKLHMFPQYAEVFLNGEKKCNLGNQGYGVFRLPPGKYEIEVSGDPATTNWGKYPETRTLVVEAGREYYVRVSLQMQSGPILSAVVNAQTRIVPVPKEQALKEIAEAKLHHSGVLGTGPDASLDPKEAYEAKQRAEERRRPAEAKRQMQEYSNRCEGMGYERNSSAWRDCVSKHIREAAEPYLARCE